MRHVDWTGVLLDSLSLTNIVLFGQDWGGLIFLVHAGRSPERFRGIVAANTALPDPDANPDDIPPEAFAPFAHSRYDTF